MEIILRRHPTLGYVNGATVVFSHKGETLKRLLIAIAVANFEQSREDVSATLSPGAARASIIGDRLTMITHDGVLCPIEVKAMKLVLRGSYLLDISAACVDVAVLMERAKEIYTDLTRIVSLAPLPAEFPAQHGEA